jgi:hypothetical protein
VSVCERVSVGVTVRACERVSVGVTVKACERWGDGDCESV